MSPISPNLSHMQSREKKLIFGSHRWEASIKEWVKMSEEEVIQRQMDGEKAKQDALDAQNQNA